MREEHRRHMARLVALGLFERADDQGFPSNYRKLKSTGCCDCCAKAPLGCYEGAMSPICTRPIHTVAEKIEDAAEAELAAAA